MNDQSILSLFSRDPSVRNDVFVAFSLVYHRKMGKKREKVTNKKGYGTIKKLTEQVKPMYRESQRSIVTAVLESVTDRKRIAIS